MTTAAPTEAPAANKLVGLIVASIVIGALSAVFASVFLWLVEEGQHFLFGELPHSWGLDQAPWWWAALLLLAAAGIVALARKLPGATGTGPLTGFHFDNPLTAVPGILLAAVASLVAGVALGPEAPLIVLGSALGGILAMKQEPQTRKAFMFLGGVAAISAVFGNPFITGFMILEFVALGLAPAVLLVPVFTALASSYVVSIGLWNIPGLGVHPLTVPGLPAYPAIQPGDFLLAIGVSIVAGLVAIIAREGGNVVDRLATKKPVVMLFVAALITSAVLFVGQELVGVNQNQILFSGNGGMPDLIAQTSLGVAIFILLAKAIAYAVALGGGFRGGPIFPVTFLGVAVGVIAHLIFPGVSVSALAAAGIAASASAFLKLPATSALLGALLIAGTGAAIAPFAIFGSVIGFVIRLAVDSTAAAKKISPELS